MRRGWLPIALFLPLAAHAQLALFAVNGTTETPIGTIFDIGKVALGDTRDVIFRARNMGSSNIQVTTLALNGAGFSLTKYSLPFAISVGNSQDIALHFVAGIVATYSANFQLNSLNVLVLASSVPYATLSTAVGCLGPDPVSGTFSFGTILTSATPICSFSLRNQNLQTITVGTLATSGVGFGSPQGVRTPFTLLAGESVNFTIAFAPSAAGAYSGTLTIDTRTFPLLGTAVSPMLAAPTISYDSFPLQSAQQRNLTVSLPAPAPVAFSGEVTLAFTPDTSLVKDDPSVVFAATGSRSVVFAIRQGETQALLNGQPSVVFQTGSTSGKIRVSVSSNLAFQTDPTTVLTIPPAKISIDTSLGSSRTGFVDVQLVGYDNTYSAGPMSFTFYDLSGHALGGGAINADFTSGFRDYFSRDQAAGMFKALITFPASGDVTQVGAVDIQLTNLAGTATLQRLSLPACQLNGLTCVP
jgi:hypothetical protein